MRAFLQRSKGVVLLLVLMVTAVLFVLVGSLSSTAFLDGALALNQSKDVQADLDLMSVMVMTRASLERGDFKGASLSFDLSSGTAQVEIMDESGKFNLNNLRRSKGETASLQFEMLMKDLENKGRVSVLGLAERISEFIRSSERPICTLGEMRLVQGMTEDALRELSKFVTVYSSGLVKASKAPSEVLSALSGGVRGGADLEQLRNSLERGKALSKRVSKGMAKAAPFTSEESSSFRALVSLRGSGLTRRVELAFQRQNGALRLILYNEEEAKSERFDR